MKHNKPPQYHPHASLLLLLERADPTHIQRIVSQIARIVPIRPEHAPGLRAMAIALEKQ